LTWNASASVLPAYCTHEIRNGFCQVGPYPICLVFLASVERVTTLSLREGSHFYAAVKPLSGVDCLRFYCHRSRNRDNSVIIRLRAERPRFDSRHEPGSFSLRHRVRTGSGAHPASCRMGTRGCFAGGSPLLCPDRLWGPPSLLSIGYRGFFPQG